MSRADYWQRFLIYGEPVPELEDIEIPEIV